MQQIRKYKSCGNKVLHTGNLWFGKDRIGLQAIRFFSKEWDLFEEIGRYTKDNYGKIPLLLNSLVEPGARVLVYVL